MTRAQLDRRIRSEEARDGALGPYLIDTYRKHRVSLRRTMAQRDKLRLKEGINLTISVG